MLSLVLVPASPVSATAGDPDTSFGGDGIVTTDFGKGMETAVGIAIQADDKSVVVGVVGSDRPNARFGVARYDLAGALDATFGGGDGRVVTDITPGYDEAVGVAIQDDGKIVVAGVAGKRIGVARYTTTGGLDPTFGGDGKVTTDLTNDGDYAYSVGIQETDDKIVVGGYAGGAGGRFAVARYETDGTLDPAFGGGDGWVATNLTSRYDYVDDLAIQADGKIVAAGGRTTTATGGSRWRGTTRTERSTRDSAATARSRRTSARASMPSLRSPSNRSISTSWLRDRRASDSPSFDTTRPASRTPRSAATAWRSRTSRPAWTTPTRF